MTHLVALPVLIPLFAGAIALLLELRAPRLQRPFGLLAAFAGLLAALSIGHQVAAGQVLVYLLGNWPPPFAITLVADRLAALLLVLTGAVGLAALAYAVRGWDTRGDHFHALFQFQLMGLNGAFLTGDLFNLFVFFEVLLIASYGLLLHGGGGARLRAGMHYVVFNLVGSALFLFGVSLLYAVAGTLNMADLAVKVAQLPAEDVALARAAGLVLLVVFSIKAALLPLYFWLPPAYAAAPAPAAALFAMLTKVGVYSILRVFTLVFGASSGAAAPGAADWVLGAALATLALAAVGALATRSLRQLVAWLVVGSAGTLLAMTALGAPAAIAAALFYLAHSSLAGASLFLIADMAARWRAEAGDALDRGGPSPGAWVGAAFFVAAVAAAGLPPLSGFVAKLMVLEAGRNAGVTALLWPVVLGAALLTTVALARAGSRVFWRTDEALAPTGEPQTPCAGMVPVMALLGAIVGVAVFAGPLQRYAAATADQLLDPAVYVQSVLNAAPVARESP